jgi:DNA-binding MarR family transcriptional regulator
MVNDSLSATVVSLDTVAVANRLRPVLLQVGRELRREARALGVSPGQVSLLVSIKHEPGIGVRELAARERVSPAGISGHVDRLVSAGLVARTPSPSDRRRVGLSLTEQGRKVLRNVQSRRTAWLAARLRQLNAEELDAIDAAIEPLAMLLNGEVA